MSDDVYVLLGGSDPAVSGLAIVGTHRAYDTQLRERLVEASYEYEHLWVLKVVEQRSGLVGASVHPVAILREAVTTLDEPDPDPTTFEEVGPEGEQA